MHCNKTTKNCHEQESVIAIENDNHKTMQSILKIDWSLTNQAERLNITVEDKINENCKIINVVILFDNRVDTNIDNI